ncbi:MAG: sensor histidine kinase [Holosporaceae bacterium]
MSEAVKEAVPSKRSWALRQLFPRSFLGRSLLIVMVPMLLVQLVSSYIFFERHWEHITRFLSQSTAHRLKSGMALFETLPLPKEEKLRFVKKHVGMRVACVSKIPQLPKGHHLFQSRFERALNRVLKGPYALLMKEDWTFVWKKIGPDILCFSFPTKWVLTRTSLIWFLWSLGSSLLFAVLAALFLYQQIAPLRSLAVMARSFARGAKARFYKPRGALEIRAVGETLARVFRQLHAKNKAQRDMLMGVSHDMQTPLTRMKLQLSLMDPKQEGVEPLLEDVAQMAQMVKSYIAFIQEGRLSEPKRFVPLRTLFRVLKMLDAKRSKEVTLDVPRNFFVLLDEEALERCLQNLLHNALCYAKTKIRVAIHQEKTLFHVCIEDDGEGVATQDLKRIFQPFVRLSTERQLQPHLVTGQTGLGLSIVQSLAQQMGGRVEAKASPLGGLRVLLTLPYTSPPQREAA